MGIDRDFITQAAALPYRTGDDGRLEVLLIRWRAGGGWGIPKGRIEPGWSEPYTATTEAMEEAGIEGELSDEPIGSYTFEKAMGGTRLVRVYEMKVTGEHAEYLEMSHRERRWFEARQAEEIAGKKGLRKIIRDWRDGRA